MSSANPFAPPDENLLLQRLPPDAHARLAGQLVPVRLEHRQVVYAPDRKITNVYFPLNAIGSVLAMMADGDSIEVGTTGNEGMLGAQVALGWSVSAQEVVCQVPGDALQLDVRVFVAEIGRHGDLDCVVRRYVLAYLNMVSQTAACNRLHDVHERCARWLLMTHDRANDDAFPLTHEFLANMLGVRRAGVTVALGLLRRAGLIASSPGSITVVDRVGLEDASCECYRTVRDEFGHMLANNPDSA
jgi:CRP-like cAMP-binding protein